MLIANGQVYSMPTIHNAPVYSEIPCFDDPSSVASDNAGAARAFEIPKAVGWKEAGSLLGSSVMAAFFMLGLLLLTIG
jgi:hypothetical protein